MKHITYLSIFLTGLVCLASCAKKYPGNLPEPKITSFAPAGGPKGTTVVISGTGFSGNAVMFNGVPATTAAKTSTSITVTVPAGAGIGKIAVLAGDKRINSANDFQFIYTVSTLAGDSIGGYADGVGAAAQFDYPSGIALDALGNVFVADLFWGLLRKVTPAGVVTTIAGDRSTGPTGFYNPAGVAADAWGNVYVADTFRHRIVKVTPAGAMFTLAGGNNAGQPGYVDGPGNVAQFAYPNAVAVDAIGNVYVADTENNMVRRITPVGMVSTFAGGGAQSFFHPRGIVVDAAGNVYLADSQNQLIRKITPAGDITTIAGDGGRGYIDGPAATARFLNPCSIAVDAKGSVYVADTGNNRIRRISPAGMVSTIAGGFVGFADGPANTALFFFPRGISIDASGNIYVADVGNNRIRKLQ
ncbi:MAG: IPT/TIG domain-containing protein [Mucilaginibacter sp.]